MASIKVENRKRQRKRSIRRYKRSMLLISVTISMLAIVIFANGLHLHAKNQAYMKTEAKLAEEIEEEKMRATDIEELKEYVGTKEYFENVAKEKLGLVYEGEILFKSQP